MVDSDEHVIKCSICGRGLIVKDIVNELPKTSDVFKKNRIDFCCGGKKSLKQVCEEKNLELATVEAALEQVSGASKPAENFD